MAKLHFLDFFQKYNGKVVDIDGFYGGQCLDLAHAYHMECLDLTDKTILAAPAAKDVYLRYPHIKGSQYFKRIPNLPWSVPKQGDLIIWGLKAGPYGHIAIVNEANVRRFTSFDQNYGADKKCRLVEHNYYGVLGWLLYKSK